MQHVCLSTVLSRMCIVTKFIIVEVVFTLDYFFDFV
jgi:hypothetical protein